MAQVFNRTFDSGTNGALATGAYNNASGLFDYDATAALHGPLGVRIRSNVSTHGVSAFTAKTRSFDQFYIHLPTALSAVGSFFKYRQGTTPVMELRRHPNGDFDIRNGFAQTGSVGTGLPTTGWVRFLVRCDATGAAGTHQMEIRAFHGANMENPDPDAYDSRALATGLTANRANWDTSTLGATDAGAYAVLVGWDSHSMDDATWPSPVGTYTPPVSDPVGYHWTGTEPIPVTEAYYWDGTTSHPVTDTGHNSGTMPPPAVQTTIFGASVGTLPGTGQDATAALADHETKVGTVPILRTFLSGAMPSSWANTGSHALSGDWQNRWSWVSFKPGITALANGSLHQQIVDYVLSIPVTGQKRLLTAHHEPENDGKSNTALQFHNAYRNFSQSVKSAGHPDVLTGPIFMGHGNIMSANNGWAVNEIITAGGGAAELAPVWDFVGWDPYYETSQLGTFNPANAADWYLQPCRDYVTDTFDATMPMAIGETGCTNNTTSINGFAPLEYRPWMMLDVETWCNSHNVLACCYFDSTGGDVPWWIRVYTSERGSQGWPSAPYPTDQASIDTWAGVYARNPLP